MRSITIIFKVVYDIFQNNRALEASVGRPVFFFCLKARLTSNPGKLVLLCKQATRRWMQ
jgi:hypothetical protein